ncbi:membrane protein [Ornithinimicrobium pekingense]|uniref:Membrane protein n=2 Tax=Ornithinimicrobium pekingense TaxID=384677 RepID=A0ABQ2FCA7_9MICO|nr:membrane protein [Ornithinimicrobium pekingense]
MNDMIPGLPALGALLAFLIFVAGLRMVRSDVVDGLDAGDLRLLQEERQREARGQLSLLERLGGRLVPVLRRLLDGPALRWLSRLIHYAGRPRGITVDSVLRRVGGWLVLMIPLSVLLVVNGLWFLAPLVLVLAFVMPVSGLAGTANRRREEIDADLPDFLDILAVTVTAGIAFRPALRRVASRFGGALAEDVNLALDQLLHGASVRDAFEQMRDRSTSVMMDRFVRAFLQAEELGAPLAETLNQIALDMRRDNAQRLRQKAGQAAPRVTLVGSTVLVPAALILILVGAFFGMDFDIDLGAILGGF